MKKAIVLSLFAGILALILFQSVSAYTTYVDTPYFSASYNPRYGGDFYTTENHKPTYYYTKYPAIYRKARYGGTSEDPVVKWIDKGDSFGDKVKRARAAAWVFESYDWRYNYASGKSSGYVFGGDEKPAKSYSNWRHKEAYDPRVHGPGISSRQDYYYKPRYDHETQTFNWRY